MLAPWKKSYDQPRQHIKKQRHYFANKGLSSQRYVFSSSHVWMWELDYKDSWALKNWCFWTVVLEKTLFLKLIYFFLKDNCFIEFCCFLKLQHARETISKVKRQPLRMGENNSKWNNWQRTVSKIYKQLIQLNAEKQTTQSKSGKKT